jgi:hypothetical protein
MFKNKFCVLCLRLILSITFIGLGAFAARIRCSLLGLSAALGVRSVPTFLCPSRSSSSSYQGPDDDDDDDRDVHRNVVHYVHLTRLIVREDYINYNIYFYG